MTWALMVTGVACGDGSMDDGMAGGDGDGDGPVDVTIQFGAQVGDAAFACDAMYDGLGMDAALMEPRDFRLYVHDLSLLTATGEAVAIELEQDGVWQVDDLALLDFEDNTGSCLNGTEETHTVVTGSVPAGDYVGLSFGVGVPATLNHNDPAAAPSPLNLTALHWNWAGGYKHVRMDFAAHTTNEMDEPVIVPVNFHLGSTVCTGDPTVGDEVVCENDNRPAITLDVFDADSDQVVIDYAALVASIPLTADQGGAPGCMSSGMDPECGGVFAALGLSLATGQVQDGQTVFSAEAL